MMGRSQAYGSALVKGFVTHNSEIFGGAVIEPTGEVYGNSSISGNAIITEAVYNLVRSTNP